jgi:uncharacterized membrane protein YsdA (DUF1294 family)/cold shock CspA family protein
MQKQGRVVRWDAARAFGFIRSPDTSADVFFHARDFRGGAAPREGQAVVYEEIHVGGKGPRAMAVQPAVHTGDAARSTPVTSRYASAPAPVRAPAPTQVPQRKAQSPRSHRRSSSKPQAASAAAVPALLLMVGWGALLAGGVWAGRLPLWIFGAAVAVNLLTFVVYAADKSAAQGGQWRTRESHLHLLSLGGGWPGAWVAQQWLRHKSRKAAFRAMYWATVVLHCAALSAWVGGWAR